MLALLVVVPGVATASATCTWPHSASGVECDMDLGHRAALASSAACEAACCANGLCATWQYGDASCGATSGCGCWLGHKNEGGKPTGCRVSAHWVGGSRVPPSNAPPPAPPPGPPPLLPENALLWPKPQQHSIGSTLLRVDADAFLFALAAPPLRAGKHPAGGTLPSAFERYRAICFPPTSLVTPASPAGLPVLSGLSVTVASADETLDMETSEKYTLEIPAGGGNATLTADTVYGALRGLESFSQMLQPDLTILEQAVEDWPRFPFRAVLIDTGRHYLPVAVLEAHIDAMSYNKMNVLHWHIVDIPSFPFVST